MYQTLETRSKDFSTAIDNTLLQRGGLASAIVLLVGDSGSERATDAEWVEELEQVESEYGTHKEAVDIINACCVVLHFYSLMESVQKP